MSSELAIEAEGLGKRYLLGERGRTVMKRNREELWALRDATFRIERGQAVGVVGHNGAGKTTLLKILSRITAPTTGEARITGSVGSLLEVGTGFHPELSGRDNVYLNGAILGMRRAEIARKFDEIVEFAEVERFIDTPVKRYSSGMYLRLAFAVAAHLEPEVLIVDEVLAVGDMAFQEKCLGRMEQVAGEGRTVLFVSHNLTAVQKLCARSMLLSKGEKVVEGPTREVVEQYIADVRSDMNMDLAERADRQGSGRFRFTSIGFESNGATVDVPVTGEDLVIVLAYESTGQRIRHPTFSVSFSTALGELLLNCQSQVAGADLSEAPQAGEVRCHIPRLPLPAGRYVLNVFGTAGSEVADWIQRAADLTVAEGDFFGSGQRPAESHRTVLVHQTWELRERAPVHT